MPVIQCVPGTWHTLYIFLSTKEQKTVTVEARDIDREEWFALLLDDDQPLGYACACHKLLANASQYAHDLQYTAHCPSAGASATHLGISVLSEGSPTG